MRVKVTGYMGFKKFMGHQSDIQIEIQQGCTLRDVLDELSNRFSEDFDTLLYDRGTNTVKSSIMIFLNGSSYLNSYDRLNFKVKDGDRIVLCPVMTGG
jgi:molybdopterin converting factor small subunit